jgi:hypothetical protein
LLRGSRTSVQPTFRQQRFDLGPERAAGLLFGLRELRQSGRVKQAGQVGVGFPVLEDLGDRLSCSRRAAFEKS